MAHLTAEIVSIGDEMTSGARLDTNTQWLSRRLGEIGIEVLYHSTVGDTLAHVTDVFRIATRRADFVVATGGLGPTRDDLTREAIGEALGLPLKLDEESLAYIEGLFSRRSRDMPERNRVQAMLPLGSQAIFNPQGTAPGIDATATREDSTASRIFALPGVPAEMKTMFDETVAPALVAAGGGANLVIRHSVMKFFGTGESDMEHRLGEMIARERVPRVGITVSAATISLRITAMGASEQECEAMIQSTREEILERVGDLHFGDGESFEQQHSVDAQLRQLNQKLVVVELGRAAPLCDWFAGLGETPALAGGLSLACVADLDRLVGSPANESETSMFGELKQEFQADWLLLVDGYPSLEAAEGQALPAAEITFTISKPDGSVVRRSETLGGHPSIVHPRMAKAALTFIRKVLSGSVS